MKDGYADRLRSRITMAKSQAIMAEKVGKLDLAEKLYVQIKNLERTLREYLMTQEEGP